MGYILIVLALPLLIWQVVKGGSWNTPQVKLAAAMIVVGIVLTLLIY